MENQKPEEALKIKVKQNRFIIVYAISLFLCFSPLKPLAFISPLFVIFLMVFYVQVRPIYNLLKLTLFLLLYSVVGLLYFFVNKDFLWLNFIFWLLTNSSYLFFIVSFRGLMDTNLLQRMASLTFKVLLVEACLGVIQVLFNAIFITHGFDGGTGDAAMGTVNPTFGVGDGKGSNIYYAIGLSALAVLVFMFHKYDRMKIHPIKYLIVVLGWVVASVMHSIFMLIASVLIAIFLFIFFPRKNKSAGFIKQLKVVRKISISVFVIVIILFLFLPGNVRLLGNYYRQSFTMESLQSTKTLSTLVTLTGLSRDKPYQMYMGIGPGQYCSRAGMILSGEYLGGGKTQFIKSVSPDLDKYLLPIWLEYLSWDFQAGSTYFPFFSWLSLYGEFGIIGWFFLILSIFIFCKRLLSKVDSDNLYLILGLLIIMFYLFFLGVQDNYWEWTQFVLPIVIFSKVVYYKATKPN